VGQNLRDHPYVTMFFRETGPTPAVHHPSLQVILRYTAAGSTTRNDMQIGPLALHSAYLPPTVPIAPEQPCFALYAAIHSAVGAGELTLTSADPHVQPALDYRYLADPWDRARLREAVGHALRLTANPAFKDVLVDQVSLTNEDLASDAALDAWLPRNIGMAGFHSAGTCKMGPASDPLAVVDQFCHVHGLDGLRVVDASVMPDVVRANTNTTTIMIAERVADWMKEGR
jgi:choline dehydrogenase